MTPTLSDYHSYLLRLWRVKQDGDAWRASLEDVQSGELHGFADLDALLRYLEALDCAGQEQDLIEQQEPEEGRGHRGRPRP